MKYQLIFVTILLGWWPCFAQWDLNDVSYLMPLPKNSSDDKLLHLNSAARGGFLLHPAFLSQLPVLTLADRPADMVEKLRVVSVRLDPCFPLPTPQDCQRQVRLIWQPLELGRRQQYRFADTALHSFYELSDREFLSLLRDIAKWKSKYRFSTRGKALQIHPAWAHSGSVSPALLEFQEILKRHIGMYNFRRVTAMFLRGAGNMWAFASYELFEGKLRPQPIHRLNGKKAQTFVNLALPSDHFQGAGMSPKAQGDDILDLLLELPLPSAGVSEDVITKNFASLYRMENPRYYHPENLDCVSCHIAQPVKQAYFNKRPDLKLQQVALEFQYKNSRYNLQNISPHLNDTQIIRGFGYFDQEPAISQRAIHESAEVADWLNRALR